MWTDDPHPLSSAGTHPDLVRAEAAGAGEEIHAVLEVPNWAPWLRFSAEQFEAHSKRFSAGQFFLRDGTGRPAACLTTNRVQWHARIGNLLSWDGVCGGGWDFEETYVANGNAIVFLSIAVRPDLHGTRLPSVLMHLAREYAHTAGLEFLLWSLRPSEYGLYKLAHPDPGFSAYSGLTRVDGRPLDRWMRTGSHEGMSPIGVDKRAMVVPVHYDEFVEFESLYHPELWRLEDPRAAVARISDHEPQRNLVAVDEVWECGEAGTWYVSRDEHKAVYIESNLLCSIPKDWTSRIVQR